MSDVVFTAVRMMMFIWVFAPCRLTSALKMETESFSETLASAYESAWH
jgi:hypothetical protein